MFESLDDPVGPPPAAETRARVADVVRRRRRRRIGAVVAAVALLGASAAALAARPHDRPNVALSAKAPDLPVTVPTVVDPSTTVPAPITTLPVITTTSTTVAAIPPTTLPAPPVVAGDWELRAPLSPDATYGPNVRGEVAARRVAGTPYRWTGTFVADGLAPGSSGSLLISHEGSGGPFASTVCRYQADRAGRGSCTGEFDTFEYTNDPDRRLTTASVMGPTGNAVAYGRFA